ncbi:MAG: glycosyltransferase family 2 protein [Gammaproteobacteria bacterium]|nr:glycosyltransferase family 2 protein [Gammaproteobacteria bacterium]
MMTTNLPVSIAVLTFNEEKNIGRCLDSVKWCNDIVVLDSNSTDATCNIVEERNARIYTRVFDNYANQRNYALKEIEYKNPWILMLDADEVVPEEMLEEMEKVLPVAGDDVTLFQMRRKDYFFGSWLKHSSSYSSLWFGRLGRVGRFWVEREINEEYHTDGSIEKLNSALIHYPFNKGIHSWLEKHNRYSSMEAELILKQKVSATSWKGLLSQDPVLRRKSLKSIIYSLPGKPVIMFLGRYFLAGGVLDGRAGLRYCLLKTIYEYMIDCKLSELKRIKKDLPV